MIKDLLKIFLTLNLSSKIRTRVLTELKKTTYDDHDDIKWTKVEIFNEPKTISLKTNQLAFITKRAGKNCRKRIVNINSNLFNR